MKVFKSYFWFYAAPLNFALTGLDLHFTGCLNAHEVALHFCTRRLGLPSCTIRAGRSGQNATRRKEHRAAISACKVHLDRQVCHPHIHCAWGGGGFRWCPPRNPVLEKPAGDVSLGQESPDVPDGATVEVIVEAGRLRVTVNGTQFGPTVEGLPRP